MTIIKFLRMYQISVTQQIAEEREERKWETELFEKSLFKFNTIKKILSHIQARDLRAIN